MYGRRVDIYVKGVKQTSRALPVEELQLAQLPLWSRGPCLRYLRLIGAKNDLQLWFRV
jgi:hypothetical protein